MGNKTENKDIKLGAFYSFFKDLNQPTENSSADINDGINSIINDGDEILNSHITESEI